MSDQELVAAVAEKVMPLGVHPQANSSTNRVLVYSDGGFRTWKPLESWDDCFLVVRAMREKGYIFDMADNRTLEDISVAFYHVGRFAGATRCLRVDETAQRKAILEAAFKAVQA